MKAFLMMVAVLIGSSVFAVAPKFREERFKLYLDPRHEVTPGCDMHTELTLDTAKLSGKLALLENRLSGMCEMAVSPDQRVYKVLSVQEDCGSVVINAQWLTEQGRLRQLRVQDNRTRICEDVRPALIEVTETRANGDSVRMYSSDNQRN